MSKLRFASRLSSFGVASVLHPTCCHTVNLKFTGYGKKITILQCPMSSLDLFSSFNDTRLVQYKTYYGMFDVSIFMINTPHTRTWIVYYKKNLRNWDWNITNVIGIEINIPLSDNFGPKQMSHHPWTDWVSKSTEDQVCSSLRGANGSLGMTT